MLLKTRVNTKAKKLRKILQQPQKRTENVYLMLLGHAVTQVVTLHLPK